MFDFEMERCKFLARFPGIFSQHERCALLRHIMSKKAVRLSMNQQQHFSGDNVHFQQPSFLMEHSVTGVLSTKVVLSIAGRDG